MAVDYKDWLARKRASLADFIRAEARDATTAGRAAGYAAAAFDLAGVRPPAPDVLMAAAMELYPERKVKPAPAPPAAEEPVVAKLSAVPDDEELTPKKVRKPRSVRKVREQRKPRMKKPVVSDD